MKRNKTYVNHSLILLAICCFFQKHTFSTSIYNATISEICNNGIDDDQDGLIDCYDPDCCGDIDCENIYYDPCAIHCQETATPQPLNIKLEWNSPDNNWHPYNTPIVGDFDGDGEVEIVGNKGNWQGLIDYKNILVLNGKDGSIEKEIVTPWFRHTGEEMAIADADQNGYGEIYFKIGSSFINDANIRNKMTCYEYDGNEYILKWLSDSIANGVIPALADFNYDGVPELYIGHSIFNSLTGELLVKGNANSSNGNGMSVAVDILQDQDCAFCDGLELVVGNEVYAVRIDPTGSSPNSLTLYNKVFGGLIADGFTSVADMDQDGDLDAIVSSPDGESQATIYIWDVQNPIVMTQHTFEAKTNGWASLPSIRDINQDRTPDIFVSSSNSLRMLSYVGEVLRETWVMETEDWSSRSGCTVFDLNDDGFFELFHRDQAMLRILDAQTGDLLFSDECLSTNLYEHPVIVDVDGDEEAEILCSCENELRAYGAENSTWTKTRAIWNQYNYHYVNVEDDLSIPVQQQAHHLPGESATLNTFLNQYANDFYDFFLSVDLPPSAVLQYGNALTLTPQTMSDSPLSFEWFPGEGISCTTCPNPEVSPEADIIYSVAVTNEIGCSDTAFISIAVIHCGTSSFAIPNAFTPDSDDLNDYFEIFTKEGLNPEGSIRIFNRWGQKVFAANNLTAKWDGRFKGKMQPSDYYLYQVNYQCDDGTEQIIKGGLLLIR